LLGKLVPVDEKEDTFSAPCAYQPFQVKTDQIGFAGACREFNEKPALAELYCSIESPHRFLLIIPNRSASPPGERNDQGFRSLQAACASFAFPPDVRDRVARKTSSRPVRQEYKGFIELLRIRERLLFGDIGIESPFFGFNHG
jgi:hypothetical protein